jgi:hypothetical protein
MNKNYNLARAEPIIRQVISRMHPGKRYYLHDADDSNKGIGHTFKIPRSAGMANVWGPILKELKQDGQTWYRSKLYHYKTDKNGKLVLDEDGNKIKLQSDWIGIRTEKDFKKSSSPWTSELHNQMIH